MPSDFERTSDGLDLGRIRREPGFYALERLLQRMKEDLFLRWSTSETLTKDYCKGALEVLDTIIPTVDQHIEAAHDQVRQERDLTTMARNTGDLAV